MRQVKKMYAMVECCVAVAYIFIQVSALYFEGEF
jgi:hypothetical protein